MIYLELKQLFLSRAQKSLTLLCCLACISSVNAESYAIKKITLGDKTFRALEVKPRHVMLHWKNADGEAYGGFSGVEKALNNQQREIIAMMNAGIYTKDYQPAGLHVENGKKIKALNTKTGKGNFHLQPNGVFLIDNNNQAKIVTTRYYKRHYNGKEANLRLATQSGPMLLINGKMNRKFIKNSRYAYTRSGVCTTPKGALYFVATDTFPRVTSNFYQFASAMKKLGCNNALYLDGNISKLYVNGEDSVFHFFPFVGVLSVSKY